jgi:hypothetical protein
MFVFKSLLWVAMPPTAFLSLASLLTYLAFRLYCLATPEHVEHDSPSNNGNTKRLRTVALPWVFFGLELLILRMLVSTTTTTIATRY